jgi:hypothetical protein
MAMKHFLHVIIGVLMLVFISPQNGQPEEIVNNVFLLEKQDRLLAFSGQSNRWFEKDLRTGEKVIKSTYEGNVAVAYTNERALAFSAITSRWAGERFRIRESVISISAKGNIATVITDIRALAFSAQNGIWVETLFTLGD